MENMLSQYIRSVRLDRESIPSSDIYPFNLPAIRDFHELELHPKVTYIVGENGSGKSTILEAIAAAFGFNPEGGTRNFNFSTKESHSDLYKYIRLVKGTKQPRDGFFLRSESFYNVASNIDTLDAQTGPLEHIIDSYGGQSLHTMSHGEAFISLFLNRFNGYGLYILDEPEAALSPSRQMSIVTRIHQLAQKRSQFIISTHSPIILSYPNSIIYEFKDTLKQVIYEQTETYQIMKSFVNNTKNILDILMEDI